MHDPNRGRSGHTAWNKGLTNSDPRVARISEKLIGKKYPGRSVSEEQRQQISESMKIAHAEGRAWNIGQSRWNNEPSYPEKFFIQVIENDFSDKAYTREMPFGRYSVDFAWKHKKLCIEIDGEQHERFDDYKARDERKTKELNDAGWLVLRIVWKEMFKNPKHYIKLANDFIGL